MTGRKDSCTTFMADQYRATADRVAYYTHTQKNVGEGGHQTVGKYDLVISFADISQYVGQLVTP